MQQSGQVSRVDSGQVVASEPAGGRLEVRVHNQSAAPECPASGTFEYTIFPAEPSTEFSQVCQDKLLTLVYDLDPQKPSGVKPQSALRVSEQRGVRLRVADYGKIESAPLCEHLFAPLEQSGYERDVNLRVAGYDFRLTPDMGGFMERTTALIELTRAPRFAGFLPRGRA